MPVSGMQLTWKVRFRFHSYDDALVSVAEHSFGLTV